MKIPHPHFAPHSFIALMMGIKLLPFSVREYSGISDEEVRAIYEKSYQ